MNPGDILDGRYEITARLGAGGMGEVYRARHTFLGATRVIKVVHPHIAGNTDAKDRFLREAQVATKVHHPNVATLHDFAALPDGAHYMVWEFIDGENLAQRLRTKGTLPPRQALRIAIQALHGLEAIHRAGIVHRDISPENIMITADDAVKIIDLGVAKMDDPDAVSQTRTGIFVGKLRYAAPEQLGFLAENEKIDGRADIYALAMVIVELLTGRPPYEAKSPHEYFLHHARELPQTTVTLPATLPGSAALTAVLQKALSHARNDRFATANEFAAALEDIDRILPSQADTPTVAVPLDGDATLKQQTTVRTPMPDAAPTQRLATPLPASGGPTEKLPIVVPPGAKTVKTPVRGETPPASRPMSGKPIGVAVGIAAAVAFVGLLLVGAGAYAFWPRISAAISPLLPKSRQATPSDVKPAAKVAERAPQSDVVVTPATATEEPIFEITTSTATPPTKADSLPPVVITMRVPGGEGKAGTEVVTRRVDFGEPPPVVKQEEREEEPPPVRRVAVYVDGPGRGAGNERALDTLRRELRGVREVALNAGGMQVPLFRAIHRYVPDLTFNADADVVIQFDATAERLRREGAHLTARATIQKGGRVIFQYELPGSVDSSAAADAFAQTLADAFVD